MLALFHRSARHKWRNKDSQVSDLSRLLVLRKYCGFSMTGILVMPMMTASAFMSEDEGVLEPLDTWWRGLAESSSLLMTEEGPVSKTKICIQNHYIQRAFIKHFILLLQESGTANFYIDLSQGKFNIQCHNPLVQCFNKMKQQKWSIKASEPSWKDWHRLKSNVRKEKCNTSFLAGYLYLQKSKTLRLVGLFQYKLEINWKVWFRIIIQNK